MAKTKDKYKPNELNVLPESIGRGTAQFADFRTETITQRKIREGMTHNPRNEATAQLRQGMQDSTGNMPTPIQRKSNTTGLPDQLKSGIENLSGYSMDDVKVHYNSSKPAQLQAHAYAQGTNIHLAPGQEKHLGHEAWHVVQQKQGRVKPTMQLKGKVNVNDDSGLEKEADVMGAKAQLGQPLQRVALADSQVEGQTVQMERYEELVNQYGGDGANGRVLVIEINMSGSANPFLDPGDKQRNKDWRLEENTQWPVHRTKIPITTFRFLRKQTEFEGPGGPNTKGLGAILRGGSDSGSNSTKKLKKLVPEYVKDMVASVSHEAWAKIVVIITAHSRGAVAAYHVAHDIKFDNPDWHVELVQFDPVPGPGQKISNQKGHLPTTEDWMRNEPLIGPIDNHTVVYSVASGWFGGFTPMQLHTMKRLIITQEDHSAGIGKVFYYRGREYQRSELNALPKGIFIETAFGRKGRLMLTSANSNEEAKELYKHAIASSKYKSDIGREKIIHDAIDAFTWGF